ATLAHVDVWNTWYDGHGNRPGGFRAAQAGIDAACMRAGRDPATLERSVCVLVRLGPDAERPDEPGVIPLEGPPEALTAGLRAFAEAGAHEVIVVCDPINEASIRYLAPIIRAARA
ncbi:MAG: hypothetical protein ACXWW5_08185, partial [Actinomycetota bacterium]